MQDANARALLDALEILTPASSYMTAAEWSQVAGAIADAAVKLEVAHWRNKYRAQDIARDKATR
jgi:hypothetical protein